MLRRWRLGRFEVAAIAAIGGALVVGGAWAWAAAPAHLLSGAVALDAVVAAPARKTHRRFRCDGTLYVNEEYASPMVLDVLAPSSGALTRVSNGVTGYRYDALALNQEDGFLYAVTYANPADESHHLVRIDADGNLDDLGALDELDDAVGAVAGTFLADGSYLFAGFMPGSGGNGLWARIDVKAVHVLEVGYIERADADLRDWATNPADGLVYGYNIATARLAVFDPWHNTLCDLGKPFFTDDEGVGVAGVRSYAAAFKTDNVLYLNLGTRPEMAPTQLFQVDVTGGQPTKLADLDVLGDFATCLYPRGPK